MKEKVLICIISFSLTSGLLGQTRKELEEQKKKTLEEIAYVDNLIKETAKKKSSSLNDLRILNNKINLQENIINDLQKESEIVNERIELNKLAIKLMEEDLKKVKQEYERAVINTYKATKRYPWIIYVLSAKDFNQGYKRLKYLQQLSKYRRNEAELIMQLKLEIERIKEGLENDYDELKKLKENEEGQKELLQKEINKKRYLVQDLTKREKELKQELEKKKRIAQRIENEIIRIIEEERKRIKATEVTPEVKLISENFEGNKGRLPWPVESGIITGNFGLQKHKELAFVTENNPGIEITSYGNTTARSIFDGEVSRVLTIPGANMAVIIKHGIYYTVYQNLVNVKVKVGDKVKTRQEIGEVYCDDEKGKTAILKFMIFKEKVKLDPEQWIVKK
ncbi:MAG: peptidoglycan DD-metalloendopeptidase family protein [Bacteroidales bacterium]